MATNNAVNTPQLTTNGQLLIGNTGNVPSAATLTAGTNITVTNAAGTITIAASGGGSGALTFIASVTASGSATVDFSNKLSSTYDNYLLIMENVAPATNSVTFQVRVGTGGGPTYQTSSYSGNAINYQSTTYSSGTGALDLTNASSTNNTSTRVSCGFINICNVNNATNDKTIVSEFGYWDTTGPNDDIALLAGRWQSGTVITSIRFLYSSGNVSTGTFKLYGIQN